MLREGRGVRGVLATSVLWALAWSPIGILVALDDRVGLNTGGWGWPSWPSLVARVVTWSVLGAINGAVFASVLATIARRRSLDTLPIRRVALWAALGALVLPAVILAAEVIEVGFAILAPGFWMVVLGLAAALGAALAASALASARRPVHLRNEEP